MIIEALTSEYMFTLVEIAAAIAVMIVILLIISHFSKKAKTSKNNNIPKEKRTAIKICLSIVRFCVILFTILAVLSFLGVNIKGAVAGLGIAGACGALAVQDLLKDLIQGLNIVSDRYFSIGDIVEYNGHVGKVIEFTMRSTKIESIVDNSILTVGNRLVTEVRKLSHMVNLKIGLSYDADMKYVYEVMGNIAKKAAEIPGIERCDFKGTQEFGDSAIIYLLCFFCKPQIYPEMRRQVLRLAQEELGKAGLKIPYMQVDVHQK